jgi:hypothetical protein
MKLTTEQTMKFLGIEKKTSLKTGNEFEIVKLADPLNYVSYDFFRTKDCYINPSLEVGEDVNASFVLSKNGFSNNLNLLSLD